MVLRIVFPLIIAIVSGHAQESTLTQKVVQCKTCNIQLGRNDHLVQVEVETEPASKQNPNYHIKRIKLGKKIIEISRHHSGLHDQGTEPEIHLLDLNMDGRTDLALRVSYRGDRNHFFAYVLSLPGDKLFYVGVYPNLYIDRENQLLISRESIGDGAYEVHEFQPSLREPYIVPNRSYIETAP